MANINKIKLSGTTYNIQDLNATKTVELTQAQYDELSPKDPNVFYIITDATAGDLSNYYTKTETDGLLDTKLDVTAYTPTDLSNYYTKPETSGATEISTALASKADTATTYTKTETDNAITAATSTKQDTLVSGTNIKTINNESILGEGNITIQGGGGSGKAIEAGRGISITTGETADTVSFSLPISAGTGTDSIIIGFNHTSSTWKPIASGNNSIASGAACKARGVNSLAFGYSNDVYGENDVAIGYGNKIENNRNEDAFAFGLANTITSNDYVGISARAAAVGGYNNIVKSFVEFGVGNSNNTSYSSNTFGDSGNTLFSVGNGDGNPSVNQTTIHRHNAFEIRQNGDIYIADTNDTSTTNYYEKPMIKLQDALGGGGGGSITIDQSLDSGSTNPVANSAITNAINSKMDEVNFASFYGDKYSAGLKGYYYDSQTETQTEKFNWGMVWQSDGSIGFDSLGNLAVFNKLDTSAITTSVTSSSTDTQVPSAKAVYDIVGNIETLLSKI